MSNYYLSSDAKIDIKEIAKSTIKGWGQAQAKTYIDGLFKVINLIGKNPNIGQSRNELGQGIRSFPQGSHVIFFMVHNKKTMIVRVLHGARDFNAIFDEDNI